jgi:hypothetical protein
MKKNILFTVLLLAFFLPISAQKLSLDSIYTETYSGFDDGELGDCLQKNMRCNAFFTQMFPFELPRNLASLRYKRIFKDSSRLQIAREYVRADDSSFYFAEYGQNRQLLRYGTVYLSYDKMVTDTIFEYDSLYNEIPKNLLYVQPIRIFKTGLWQENQKQGVKAGYYYNDLPVGIWKYFSLPVLAEFDMPSFLFHYQSGQIAKRDTMNLLEKKISDIDVKQLLSGKWLNHYENKNYLMLTRKALPVPCEVWEFLPTGEVKIQAIYSYSEQKEFVGSWTIDKSLEISLNIPDFGSPKIQLRYLDRSRLLFFK